MANGEEYRLKLRSTPKKESKHDQFMWDNASFAFDQLGFVNLPSYMSSPIKRQPRTPKASDPGSFESPHKMGHLLRTPSPPRKGNMLSPSNRRRPNIPGTPSPHKASSSTDLFGNRSLLENLPVPDWDENFLDNFQEDFLFGLGSEDIEGLIKSPTKSPAYGLRFLSPLKGSTGLSPLNGPLLTSSPKGMNNSPGLNKTPGMFGRPLTRQRRLFLQSPERQGSSSYTQPHQSSSWSSSFSPLDTSTSSMFSNGNDSTVSIQNISTYLKRFDEDEQEDEMPVMPPAGWMNNNNPMLTQPKQSRTESLLQGKGKSIGKGKTSGKNRSHSLLHQRNPVLIAPASKKPKMGPQFTLLKPQTEILNSQICLRMAPRTPPNKMKISRDFSQIQTLPSKEQLKIVRNRFRETLNKAVEQHIEKEKLRKPTRSCQPKLSVHQPRLTAHQPRLTAHQPRTAGSTPVMRSVLQRPPGTPVLLQPAGVGGTPIAVYAGQIQTITQQHHGGKKRKH